MNLTLGAITKTLAEWKLAEPVLHRQASGAHVLTVRGEAAKFDGTPIAADGDIGIFTDEGRVATRRFYGRRLPTQHDSTDEAESISYAFAGPWYWLEHLPYQQQWTTHGRDVDGNITTASGYTSQVFLNIDPPTNTLLNVGQQIQRIVEYAIAQGAPIQLGTFDVSMQPSVREEVDLYCAAAIQGQLRYAPDALIWFDYTTTPYPTMHCRRRSALTAKNVYLKGTAGTSSTSLFVSKVQPITPRYDLRAAAVAIHYVRIDVEDNVARNFGTSDIYPPTATGRELHALVSTVNLAGYQRTTVKATIECAEIDPTTALFWREHSARLGEARVKPASLVISELTRSGALSLPRELISGQIAPWMFNAQVSPLPSGALLAERDDITAKIRYEAHEDATHTLARFKLHDQTFRESLVTTNAPAGVSEWKTTSTEQEGDPVPTGVAEYLYNALNPLQYEGTFLLKANNCPFTIGLGDSVNLPGTSNAAYATMAQPIQETIERLEDGETLLRFGPPAALTLNQIIELLQANRVRRRWTNPDTQASGVFSGETTVELGRNTALRDSVEGQAPYELHTVKQDTRTIIADAEAGTHATAFNGTLPTAVRSTVATGAASHVVERGSGIYAKLQTNASHAAVHVFGTQIGGVVPYIILDTAAAAAIGFGSGNLIARPMSVQEVMVCPPAGSPSGATYAAMFVCSAIYRKT